MSFYIFCEKWKWFMSPRCPLVHMHWRHLGFVTVWGGLGFRRSDIETGSVRKASVAAWSRLLSGEGSVNRQIYRYFDASIARLAETGWPQPLYENRLLFPVSMAKHGKRVRYFAGETPLAAPSHTPMSRKILNSPKVGRLTVTRTCGLPSLFTLP